MFYEYKTTQIYSHLILTSRDPQYISVYIMVIGSERPVCIIELTF